MEAIAESRPLRVVLTGSESTGKTSMALRLAAHFGVEWVPEFVRSYAESIGRPIELRDHGPIARGQIALEEEHVARAGRLLIADTDLLSTVVYCRHYFGVVPPWIAEAAMQRRPSLYLLMDIDHPWVADGVRDRGDRRVELQAMFEEAVHESGAPHAVISGGTEARFGHAVRLISELLSR